MSANGERGRIVDVAARTVYDAKCSRCGQRKEFGNETQANQWRIRHAEAHTTSVQVADAIADQVFRSEDAPEWFGYIGNAQEGARKAGKPYLTWNGYVYRTELVDFRNPVCWTTDLPAVAPNGRRGQ